MVKPNGTHQLQYSRKIILKKSFWGNLSHLIELLCDNQRVRKVNMFFFFICMCTHRHLTRDFGRSRPLSRDKESEELVCFYGWAGDASLGT